ncbi:MAG: DUF58 domain-containing protein [Elusimicrobia bacterium]|nr:DUF58 domain-containing protein [Elusimicrobiota bacterium]
MIPPITGDRWRGAWRRFRERWRPPRVLRITRLGGQVILLALGIGFAAMNTGNNLLYVIFGLLLGLILASGLVSESMLRAVVVDHLIPADLFAGRPAPVRFILKNRSARPLLGLKVWVRFGRAGVPDRESSPSVILFIPPKGQRSRDMFFHPDRRGRWTLLEIRVGTSFPFGFFEKSLRLTPREDHVVFPAPLPFPRGALWTDSGAPRRSVPRRGPGETFWGLRDFRQGDSPRRMAWKSVARRGRLIVQETEQETDRRLILNLGAARDWGDLSLADRENAVSFAATLALRHWDAGFAVGLVEGDRVVPPASGPSVRRAILTRLALFEPDALTAPLPVDGALSVLALWRRWGKR